MKVSELTNEEQAFYTPLLIALASNPNVFQPKLTDQVLAGLDHLQNSGITDKRIYEMIKDLVGRNLELEKLFDSADKIFKEYWR